MLSDKAIEIVARRLGKRTDLIPRILDEMELVMQQKLMTARFVPWFLVSEMSGTTTFVNESRVKVPANFFAEIEDAVLEIYNPETAKWVGLDKDTFDQIDEAPSGLPKVYALTGEYFRLKPVPDKAYSLRMFYYALDKSILSGAVENAWLKNAADLVIAKTTQIMASQYTHNKELAAATVSEIAEAQERLMLASLAREHTNRTYQFGEYDGS